MGALRTLTERINGMKNVIQEAGDLNLDIIDGKNLLLTMGKVKPASIIDLSPSFYSRQAMMRDEFDDYAMPNVPVEGVPEGIINDIAYVTEKAGIEMSRERLPDDAVRVIVGADLKAHDCLRESIEAGDHRKIGWALGYPLTALSLFGPGKGAAENFYNSLREHYTRENIPSHLLYIDFAPAHVGPHVVEDHVKYGRTHMTAICRMDELCGTNFHNTYTRKRKDMIFRNEQPDVPRD